MPAGFVMQYGLPMSRTTAAIASLALLVSLASCELVPDAQATPTAPEQSEHKAIRKLLRDKPFPLEARKILNARMQQHAANMEQLLWSALVLDYPSIEKSAEGIASAPKILRPTAGPQDPLNSLLPERFFDLQDQLYANAGKLAIAAKQRDDKAIAASFSALGATCMSCHSLYLRIDADKK